MQAVGLQPKQNELHSYGMQAMCNSLFYRTYNPNGLHLGIHLKT